MRYTLKGAIVADGEIKGYEIIDNNSGITKRARIDDVAKLAERSMIDATVSIDELGIKHIAPKSKIEIAKDKFQTYTIEARIVQKDKLIGYRCKDTHGQYKRILPMKLWEMANAGFITNAKAKIINNIPTIVGEGIDLKDLPVLKL